MIAHSGVIEDVGDDQIDLHAFHEWLQVVFQEKLSGFRAIHRHDPLRGKLQQLPADFRTDAAGAAGDQYHVSVDPLPDVVDIQFYRFALQEILDRYGLRLHDQVAVDQLPVTGEHADFKQIALGAVDKFPQFLA